MSDSDTYKLSFDYRLEYAVYEQSDYLCPEQVFVSRDVNEAFREMLAMDSGGQRTLRLELKDPEVKRSIGACSRVMVGRSRDYANEEI